MHVMEKPLIVNTDCTVLLEADHPQAKEVADRLSAFAELCKSPDRLHTYRITPLSLWNAAAEGDEAREIAAFLNENARYGVPASVREHIRAVMARYGALRLEQDESAGLRLVASDWRVLRDVSQNAMVAAYLRSRIGELCFAVEPGHRGAIKQELLRAGYPVLDLAGYHTGEALPLELRDAGEDGEGVTLREYQREAVERFCRNGGGGNSGSGVIVLPCGAGKTVVGLAVMSRLKCATLILTTNTTSVKQWRNELRRKTNAREEWLGEYTGQCKQVRPITIATYHILTHRAGKGGDPVHMRLFHDRDWGLIIYDEVHLLPAPVFRMTAEIQATRRLGLTATLVREDGREDDVFSLIGPKRYELRWKRLEENGFIAKAQCVEIAVPLTGAERERYVRASHKMKHRIAGENPGKLEIVELILRKHANDAILVIGQFLDQLRHAAQRLNAPLISGSMPQAERDRWYEKFKRGEIRVLIASKVANFAVDLPSASVAIQLSGSFGSRQEEAQRLGRILRPKEGENRSYFYSLVTADSREMEYAHHRRLFLLEQGYEYRQISGEILRQSELTGG